MKELQKDKRLDLLLISNLSLSMSTKIQIKYCLYVKYLIVNHGTNQIRLLNLKFKSYFNLCPKIGLIQIPIDIAVK